jgi:hypothetical protein
MKRTMLIALILGIVSFTINQNRLSAAESGSDSIKLTVTSPSVVKKGSPFVIKAILKNTGAQSHTFVNLDVANEYLEGIRIEKSKPQFSSKEDYTEEIATYEFGKEIKPGQECVIEITATAIQEGSFEGDFDFCIDSDTEYITFTVNTEVK